VIGLKPEYEERYIILHKYTFPEVLERIHDSNIRNYSIFLRDGRLFSYYEYCGQDYDMDIQKIGEDPITRDWWKLTDPMQEPIQDRREGEWWASMDEIAYFVGTESRSADARRIAYRTKEVSILTKAKTLDISKDNINAGHIQKFSMFHKEERLYFYCELEKTSPLSPDENEEHFIDTILSRMTPDDYVYNWESMREVFHTD
jgi:L-rhamnose mutarotase